MGEAYTLAWGGAGRASPPSAALGGAAYHEIVEGALRVGQLAPHLCAPKCWTARAVSAPHATRQVSGRAAAGERPAHCQNAARRGKVQLRASTSNGRRALLRSLRFLFRRHPDRRRTADRAPEVRERRGGLGGGRLPLRCKCGGMSRQQSAKRQVCDPAPTPQPALVSTRRPHRQDKGFPTHQTRDDAHPPFGTTAYFRHAPDAAAAAMLRLL